MPFSCQSNNFQYNHIKLLLLNMALADVFLGWTDTCALWWSWWRVNNPVGKLGSSPADHRHTREVNRTLEKMREIQLLYGSKQLITDIPVLLCTAAIVLLREAKRTNLNHYPLHNFKLPFLQLIWSVENQSWSRLSSQDSWQVSRIQSIKSRTFSV